MFLNHYLLRNSLQLPQRAESVAHINSEIGQALAASGYLRCDREGLTYVARKPINSLPARPRVSVHHRWCWDIEWLDGRTWLVPRVRCAFLSSSDPDDSTVREWIQKSISGRHALNWGLGGRSRVRWIGKQFQVWRRGEWVPDEPTHWRITFSTHDQKELGVSGAANTAAALTFRNQYDQLAVSPITHVLETVEGAAPRPRELSPVELASVAGGGLQFRDGTSPDIKAIRRLKALKPPSKSFIAFAVPDTALVASREAVRRVRSASEDLGWKINMDSAVGLTYSSATGQLTAIGRARLSEVLAKAPQNCATLCVLDESIGKAQRNGLHRALRSLNPVMDARLETLGRRPVSYGIAFKLLQLAGGVPCRLPDLPDADGSTVFVGIDLGHDHSAGRSKVAFTLFSPHGACKGIRTLEEEANDERISSAAIGQLAFFVRERYPNPKKIIVHRDGRFLKGEVEDLQAALTGVPLSLLAVKKDSNSLFSKESSVGDCVRLGPTRVLLLTSDQTGGRSCPRPIEVELVQTGGLSLENAAAHVFWLCRVASAALYQTSRLPATTRLANDHARTGRRRASRQ